MSKSKSPIKAVILLIVTLVALLPLFLNFGTALAGELDLSATFWSLVPPIIAIAFALVTKEVYSSLFIGILVGALYANSFNIFSTFTGVTNALIENIGDEWNIGILIFLVILGIIVALMNKAGGSAAYGRWASQRIKTRTGAQLSTMGLGILIFVDDYFNCLTVGSVMMPITDKHNISRAKLAYVIDSTAAPICIMAPISSWAAAVTSYAPEGEGINLFIKTIPFNYYAILTLVMIIVISILKMDYGPMVKMEKMAMEDGDLFGGTGNEYVTATDEKENDKGRVMDLILPIIFLIALCVIGMIYTGGFFEGETFIDAFSASDAAVGLSLGSLVALIFIFVYYMIRRVLSFKDFASCLPDGFRQMVPAILILCFAWTLSSFVRGDLDAGGFVEQNLAGAAQNFQAFLPAIFFLIACGIAFATGTSWGTFGILIPLALAVFPEIGLIQTISISACLGGAVMGDHCSPISDTTIMSSTGAQCNHLQHVATQTPYALTVAAIAFINYIIIGFLQTAMSSDTLVSIIGLIIGIVLMVGTLLVINSMQKKKAKA